MGRYHSRLVSGDEQADAGIGAAIAESFVEATDGVVIVGDGSR